MEGGGAVVSSRVGSAWFRFSGYLVEVGVAGGKRWRGDAAAIGHVFICFIRFKLALRYFYNTSMV